jgi:purine-binding chemotaxis protein CheW
VVKLDDGLILIHNLDKFLSLDEETALGRAIEDN